MAKLIHRKSQNKEGLPVSWALSYPSEVSAGLLSCLSHDVPELHFEHGDTANTCPSSASS